MEKVVSFPQRDLQHQDIIEAEFSDIGRNYRFQPGWYILPVVIAGFIGLGAVLAHFTGYL